jgi:hypothetical protein
MDFVRSYFGTNEPLTSWTLLWGKKCSTGQRFICIEITSYKIHTLVPHFFLYFTTKYIPLIAQYFTYNALSFYGLMSMVVNLRRLNYRDLQFCDCLCIHLDSNLILWPRILALCQQCFSRRHSTNIRCPRNDVEFGGILTCSGSLFLLP